MSAKRMFVLLFSCHYVYCFTGDPVMYLPPFEVRTVKDRPPAFVGNQGFDSKQGFADNQGFASNQGFTSNQGFVSNQGFASNQAMVNNQQLQQPQQPQQSQQPQPNRHIATQQSQLQPIVHSTINTTPAPKPRVEKENVVPPESQNFTFTELLDALNDIETKKVDNHGASRASEYDYQQYPYDYRQYGYQGEQRPYGYQAEQRPYGYQAEQRPYGYQAEQRPYGYQAEQRPYGYQAEQRPYGYQAEQRPYGYQAEQRPYGYQPYSRPTPNSYHEPTPYSHPPATHHSGSKLSLLKPDLSDLVKPVTTKVAGKVSGLIGLVLALLTGSSPNDLELKGFKDIVVNGIVKPLLLAKGGIKTLVSKLTIPIISLMLINLEMLITVWWLWEDCPDNSPPPYNPKPNYGYNSYR